MKRQIQITLVCLFVMLTSQAFAQELEDPNWYHRNSVECTMSTDNCTIEPSWSPFQYDSCWVYWNCDIGPFGPWGNDPPIEVGNWNFAMPLLSIDGLARYITTTTPTFKFNINGDGSDPVAYEFILARDGLESGMLDFAYNAVTGTYDNAIIHYLSAEIYDNSTNNFGDCSFTVLQEEGEGNYFKGENLDIGGYGEAYNYYWCVRAVDNDTGEMYTSDWLCSGGGSDIEAVAPGFSKAKYFTSDNNTRYTIIGAVTQNTAELSFASPDPVDYRIVFGEDESLSEETLTGEVIKYNVSGHQKATLTGLDNNTKYYYQLQHRTGGANTDDPYDTDGEIKSFFTAMPSDEDESFVFGITADLHITHNNDIDFVSSSMELVKDRLEGIGSKFWVDLGDLIISDNQVFYDQAQADSYYTFLHEAIARVGVPLMLTNGNHEQVNSYYGTQTSEMGAGSHYNPLVNHLVNSYGEPTYLYGVAYEKTFPYYDHGEIRSDEGVPDYNTFYSWEWGDTLFVVLDLYLYTKEYPDTCDKFRLGTDQGNWLRGILRNNDKKWIMIFIHQHGGRSLEVGNSCYGRGGAESLNDLAHYNDNSSIMDFLDPEDPNDSIADSNVILFLGHDHIYNYSRYKNMHVINVPSLTYPLSNLTWNDFGFSHTEKNNYLYDTEAAFTAIIDEKPGADMFTFTSGAGLDNLPDSKKLALCNSDTDTCGLTTAAGINFDDISDNGSFVMTPNAGNYKYDEWKKGHTIGWYPAKAGMLKVTVDPEFVKIQVLNEKGTVIDNNTITDFRTDFKISDSDGDGIYFSVGNEYTCRGGEIENCDDNCREMANPDQVDTDNDSIGDACDPCNNNDDQAPIVSIPILTGTGEQLSSDPLFPTLVERALIAISWGWSDNSEGINEITWKYRPVGPGTYTPHIVYPDSQGAGGAVIDLTWAWAHTSVIADNGTYEFKVTVEDCAENITESGSYYLCLGSDGDGDGVCDEIDNCPLQENPLQEDSDEDGFGNVCDSCPYDAANDVDEDNICACTSQACDAPCTGGNTTDCDDNCPTVFNPGQEDGDGDGRGDACECYDTGLWCYNTYDGQDLHPEQCCSGMCGQHGPEWYDINCIDDLAALGDGACDLDNGIGWYNGYTDGTSICCNGTVMPGNICGP